MTNLPREPHRLNTHVRHLEKSLTALLWTARFRWTAPGVIDHLLGGNGLVRQLVKCDLLVAHPISHPFSPVRYYVTLSKPGLAMLDQHWAEITRGEQGDFAARLASGWNLPQRPEHRIRTARFEHDLQVQIALVRTFHIGRPIQSVFLADDLERVALAKRPSKIPDVVIVLGPDVETGTATTTFWGEVEYSRKNQREIDLFCAYYRGALAGVSERKFDKLIVLCHESVLAQWRRDFARPTVPKWHFHKGSRAWIRLDQKDWHYFPEISAEEVAAIILPLTPKSEDDSDA